MRDAIDRTKTGGFMNTAARVVGHLHNKLAVAQLASLSRQGVLEIGAHTYGLPTVHVSHPDDRVYIGKFCSIAPGVTLVPGGIHPTDSLSTFPFKTRWGHEHVDSFVERKGPINVHHDVWLGTGALLLSGVTVETGAIIAAGAVVTRDVPAYSVAAGVPARVIGRRLPQVATDLLLASRWWELDDALLAQCMDEFAGHDVEAFIRCIDAGRRTSNSVH